MTVAPMTTNYLAIYQRRRSDILELAQQQLEICDALGLDETQADGKKPGEQLRGLLTRLETDRLRVLVIGRFNSGKTTFLNALLGERILPATPLPTTAVPCEIRYAEEQDKHGVLHLKPVEGGRRPAKPRSIAIADLKRELERSVVIDGEETSLYERAEVHWPIELCKHGVHLIDTVGLDDPGQRDEITFAHVPASDTVLYCMPATSAYTGVDKTVLERIRNLSYRSIFFVVTHYQAIRNSAESGEEISEETFRRRVSANLASWTDLGENGIKYVDSMIALSAQQKKNSDLLEQSGFPALTAALERFLGDEKGRAKLLPSLGVISNVNREVRQKIPLRISMWQSNVSDLAKRYERASAPLRNLETMRSLIMTIVDNSNSSIAQRSADLADQYMLALPARVRGWIYSYTITRELPLFPSEQEVLAIVDSLTTHVHDRLSEDVAEWNGSELSAMVAKTLDGTHDAIRDQEQDFFREAQRLRREIAVAADRAKKLRQSESAQQTLRDGVSLSLTTATDQITVAPGARAAAGMIVIATVAMGILGFLALLNPVTLAFAGVAALFGGKAFGKDSAKGKIKEEIAKQFVDGIEAGRSDFTATIRKKVAAEVKKERDLIDSALTGETSSIHGEVGAILTERQKGEANADHAIQQLRKLEAQNLAIEEKVESLMIEAGLGR